VKHLLIPGILLVAVILLWIHGPIPQDQSYHAFVDQRELWGIPNFLDVVSNLPFLLVGIAGLLWARLARPVTMRNILNLLFIGFILLTIGSGWYHWDPRDETLVLDRIPIAIIFMSFFCVIIHDHIGEWYAAHLWMVLNLIGVGSVLYWHFTEQAGHGDLRPYALVQFFPLVAMPVIMKLYHSRHEHWRHVLFIYLFFGLAKLTEELDEEIFHALNGVMSGHTLKHLFMALAGTMIVVLVKDRSANRMRKWPGKSVAGS
jgi:hypothetical protein